MTTLIPAGLRSLSIARLLALLNAELETSWQIHEREEPLLSLLREFRRRGIATIDIIPEFMRFDPTRRICLDADGTRLAIRPGGNDGNVLPLDRHPGTDVAQAFFLMQLEAEARQEEEGEAGSGEAGDVRYAPDTIRQGILELLQREGLKVRRPRA